MTTTTTKITDQTPRERSGISAPGYLWKQMGFEVYSNTVTVADHRDFAGPKDIDLLLARERSGHTDERALIWLHEHLQQRADERTRSTAIARAADAGLALAKALGEIDARLRVYIQQEVQSRLQPRG